ncbi:MAG TPA: RNA-binding S4 domain-containing protein [Stellaceae bacterium]|nr:RNA-binding S4 domain-containing protein [Stellaceae bacterium]
MTLVAAAPERAKARLDQWLWFARLAKSRSLAARLCAAGAVEINGSAATKPNHTVRVGDVLVVPQGGWRRTVQVMALGTRRGPASEARTLYEEAAPPGRWREALPAWVPLLGDDDAMSEPPSAMSGEI